MTRVTFLSRLVVALLTVSVVAVFALPAGPGRAGAVDDDDGRVEIEATIESALSASGFRTEGTIRGDLEGTTTFDGDALSLGVIVDPPNGLTGTTLSYTGTLTIVTEDGTLTTRGAGIFEAVPFGVGTQFDRVVSGTGIFEGATGVFYFNFVADETGAVFTSAVTGEIQLAGGDDGDDEDDD